MKALLSLLLLVLFCTPFSAAAQNTYADPLLEQLRGIRIESVEAKPKPYDVFNFREATSKLRSLLGQYDPTAEKRVNQTAAAAAMQKYWGEVAATDPWVAESNRVARLAEADLALLAAERPTGSRLSKKEAAAQAAAWTNWAQLDWERRTAAAERSKAARAAETVRVRIVREKSAAELVESRRRAAAEFPDATEAQRQAIRAGNPAIGMTKEMARAALGEPRRRTERTTAAGTSESWQYPWGTVNFAGGRLAEWTESSP